MNIVITGSSGFIGTHLRKLFKLQGHRVICLSEEIRQFEDSYTFEEYFDNQINCQIDYFIHLASPNYDYCKDDSLKVGILDLTSKIVQKLASYDCKNFIYFSTAKVYGEPSLSMIAYTEQSPLNPLSDYAIAKYEAEKFIMEQSLNNEFKYIIYRLPMVYGYGMKSNIGNLLSIIRKSLPFVYFKNADKFKKSFLSIENIKKIITHNINNPQSINNEIFNIADSDSASLNELIFAYKKICSSNSIIFPLPAVLFNVLSKFKIFKKLYGNFVIDSQKLQNMFDLNILNIADGLTHLNVSMNKNE